MRIPVRPIVLIHLNFFLLAAGGNAEEPSSRYRELEDILETVQNFRQPLLGKQRIDYSSRAVKERLEILSRQRERLESISWKEWPTENKIDYLLVRAEIDRADFEYRVVRTWERDPGLYVDMIREIAFTNLPAREEDLEDLRDHLEAVPRLLSQARGSLAGNAAGELTHLALRNLESSDGVEHAQPYRENPPRGVVGWIQELRVGIGKHHPGLLETAEETENAVRSFQGWLRTEAPRMTQPAGVGLENYEWFLRNVEFEPFDSEDIVHIGERELARTLAALALERNRNRKLPTLEPASSREEYERRIQEADRRVRQFIVESQFISIPDYIKDLGDNTPWKVRPGGKLNFWEAVQFRDPLPDKVHAGIPGHRFDLLVHERDARPVRGKISSANRIEGWGFYLEEAMMTAGLLDKRPRTRELFHIFAAARAVRNKAEVMLHANRWTVEQAVEYMVRNVPFMDEDVARVDCEIYLREPGYGQSYQMGKVQIEALLAERARQQVADFDLGAFHDEFLAAGLIPVSLIRWELTGNSEEISDLLKSYVSLSEK